MARRCAVGVALARVLLGWALACVFLPYETVSSAFNVTRMLGELCDFMCLYKRSATVELED